MVGLVRNQISAENCLISCFFLVLASIIHIEFPQFEENQINSLSGIAVFFFRSMRIEKVFVFSFSALSFVLAMGLKLMSSFLSLQLHV